MYKLIIFDIHKNKFRLLLWKSSKTNRYKQERTLKVSLILFQYLTLLVDIKIEKEITDLINLNKESLKNHKENHLHLLIRYTSKIDDYTCLEYYIEQNYSIIN